MMGDLSQVERLKQPDRGLVFRSADGFAVGIRIWRSCFQTRHNWLGLAGESHHCAAACVQDLGHEPAAAAAAAAQPFSRAIKPPSSPACLQVRRCRITGDRLLTKGPQQTNLTLRTTPSSQGLQFVVCGVCQSSPAWPGLFWAPDRQATTSETQPFDDEFPFPQLLVRPITSEQEAPPAAPDASEQDCTLRLACLVSRCVCVHCVHLVRFSFSVRQQKCRKRSGDTWHWRCLISAQNQANST